MSTDYLDNILVIIPVRNEETTITQVIQSLKSLGFPKIRVVDNGSTDQSPINAKMAGAEVIYEPIPGYGKACWRGLQNLEPTIDWILFCDGDGSDDLSQLPQFLNQRDNFDLILGNRSATVAGKAAMTQVQSFGNRLATFLINLGWQYKYEDLGPLRLIRRSALEQIHMQDRGFGWTVEMQVRAIECNLSICELPVNYHPRQGGQSKISGTVSGSIKAGIVILSTLARLFSKRFAFSHQSSAKCRLLPPSTSCLLPFASLLLLLGAILTIPYGDFRQVEAVPRFWLGITVMSLGFVLSWRLNSISGLWFWTVTILTRMLLIFMYPGDDVWRYLWEGYIQTQGFSPYDFAPNAAALIPYRTQWWSQINHLDVSAIYPPVAQLGFRILATISPNVILFKASFVLADLLICWLLSRNFGYGKTLFYAWNPLIIYSFAGGAHYDSWFILPLVAAWLIAEGRRQKAEGRRENPFMNWVSILRTVPNESDQRYIFEQAEKDKQPKTHPSSFPSIGSALLVGISIAIKWMSLPILGFLAWQAFRRVGIKLAIIVLICGLLPLFLSSIQFCYLGKCPLIPTDSVFVSHGRSAEFLPYLIGLIWPDSLKTNWIYLFPLGFVIILLLGKAQNFRQFTEGYFFALLTISPIIHAWYFTWLIPFAVVKQNLGVRLVSISAFVYFALPYRQALGNYNWYLTAGERFLLWFPLFLRRKAGGKKSEVRSQK